MPRRPRGSFPSPSRPPKGSFPSYSDRPAGSFPTRSMASEPPSPTASVDSSSSAPMESSFGRPMPSSDCPLPEGRNLTPCKRKLKPSYSLGTKVKIFRSCLRRRVHPFASQGGGGSGGSSPIGSMNTSHSRHHSGQEEDQVPLMEFMDEYEDVYCGPF